MVYESLQHQCDSDDLEDKRQFFVPFARILPQVLKYVQFYGARPDLNPTYTEWPIMHTGEGNPYIQQDGVSCGVYALKYAEAILTGKMEQPFDMEDLKKYRKQLSETIYNFSTDESTIQVDP